MPDVAGVPLEFSDLAVIEPLNASHRLCIAQQAFRAARMTVRSEDTMNQKIKDLRDLVEQHSPSSISYTDKELRCTFTLRVRDRGRGDDEEEEAITLVFGIGNVVLHYFRAPEVASELLEMMLILGHVGRLLEGVKGLGWRLV